LALTDVFLAVTILRTHGAAHTVFSRYAVSSAVTEPLSASDTTWNIHVMTHSIHAHRVDAFSFFHITGACGCTAFYTLTVPAGSLAQMCLDKEFLILAYIVHSISSDAE